MNGLCKNLILISLLIIAIVELRLSNVQYSITNASLKAVVKEAESEIKTKMNINNEKSLKIETISY